jgi:hypothetical protein
MAKHFSRDLWAEAPARVAIKWTRLIEKDAGKLKELECGACCSPSARDSCDRSDSSAKRSRHSFEKRPSPPRKDRNREPCKRLYFIPHKSVPSRPKRPA